ncbi:MULTISPECIES: hypothetical protein [Bacillaceae]|uniref:hypothetical protein n=1 Tax=Bacillaceae TaxID=186817 RepID=UPI002A1771F7|nr:hypothetical protein [Cytobacillus sp. IB215316]MDX8363206.1 hypothetical protein [Cytobacillus sp. IB215316]
METVLLFALFAVPIFFIVLYEIIKRAVKNGIDESMTSKLTRQDISKRHQSK